MFWMGIDDVVHMGIGLVKVLVSDFCLSAEVVDTIPKRRWEILSDGVMPQSCHRAVSRS